MQSLEERAPKQDDLTRLRKLLVTHFDQEELRTLCFDLGVEHDGLRGEGKEGKARELVAYLTRHDRVPELVKACRELRPDVQWEEIPEAPPQPSKTRTEPSGVDQSQTAKLDVLSASILIYLSKQGLDDKVALSQLCETLGVSSRESVAEAVDQLVTQNLVARQNVEPQHTMCWLTHDGRIAVKDFEPQAGIGSQVKLEAPPAHNIGEPTPQASTKECPPFSWTLDKLDPRYIPIIQRQDVVEEITRILQDPSGKRIAFLYGQPQVGKTFVLEQLEKRLRDRYIPVFIHVNGWASTGSQSDFLYELAVNIQIGIESSRTRPRINPFKQVSEREATAKFTKFMHELSQRINAGGKPFLLMFDEVEFLAKEEADARIFEYLAGLVECFPHFRFVFAGSGYLLDLLEHGPLAGLWKKGEPVRVDCFEKETTQSLVKVLVAHYFVLGPGALDWIVYLADGHPSLLRKILGIIVRRCRSKGHKNPVVTVDDLNSILDDICVELSPTLKDIWRRLPFPEANALQQVAENKKRSFSIDEIIVEQRGYSEKDLHNLVQRQILDYDLQSKRYTIRLGLLVDAISQGILSWRE